jgi:hypothetical protein
VTAPSVAVCCGASWLFRYNPAAATTRINNTQIPYLRGFLGVKGTSSGPAGARCGAALPPGARLGTEALLI